MRSIVISVCILTGACGSQGLNSPAAPESANAGQAQSSAFGDELPLRGSYTLTSTGAVNCPPTCPPTVLRVVGTGEGTATQFGLFTLEMVDMVDLVNGGSTGTLAFTAANGDRLFSTTVGIEELFVPPNTSHVRLVVTVVGGTGRFASASGAFIARHVATIDFPTNTASATGSFEGRISLNN